MLLGFLLAIKTLNMDQNPNTYFKIMYFDPYLKNQIEF